MDHPLKKACTRLFAFRFNLPCHIVVASSQPSGRITGGVIALMTPLWVLIPAQTHTMLLVLLFTSIPQPCHLLRVGVQLDLAGS